jgi:beta-lactamase regulating signal transducer with metallopeptidase domain
MSAIIATATAQALMHFLWQGALVGLATWAALSFLENAKASTRYAVATGALLLMSALPFATAFRLAGLAGETAARPVSAAVSPAPAPLVSTTKAPEPSGGAVATRTFGASLLPWVFNLWLAGVAALSLAHLGGLRRVRALSRQGRPAKESLQSLARDLARRLGIRRAVALLESAAATVPATVGWLRPVVLVPVSALAGLTPLQLESILAHEMAHVRRHDYLVNLLQTAAETLLFYHPAVWWVSAQMRQERELCCDDLAVAACGDRLGYARALVELEGLRAAAPRLALAASGGSLAGRVRRLLGASDRPSRRPWAAGLLALALLPAGAVVQTACSGSTARQAMHGADSQPARTWKAERQGDRLRLTLDSRTSFWRRWTSVDEYPLSQLAGLTRGTDVRFELRRSAGTIHLRGAYDGRRGQGTFTFAADPALAEEIGAAPSDVRLLELAVYDIPASYVREMRALGYGRPAQRHGRPGIHDYVRWHFQALAGTLERSASLQQLEELRVQGITPEFVRAIQESGYRDISSSDLMELRIHGVDAVWVRAVSASGYPRPLPFQLVELHGHGISPEWLRGVVQAGYGSATTDQLLAMHEHGIDGDSIRRAGGAGRLTPEDLVSLQARGRLGR